ncbi:MAG: hypothetical protein ABW252_06650 [Polyangiales bacterium]
MRFLFGFATASVVWALALALLYTTGIVVIPDDGSEDDEAAAAPAEDEADEDPKARARRPRRARKDRDRGRVAKERVGERAEAERPDKAAPVPTGEATTGDDLDWSGERRVDMAAGEAQLAGTQIEAGFDGAMGKIRRCLVLVPGDATVTGKLVFGMRVGADGVPRAVNLTGPRAVTEGESGGCLRQAAQAIRFPKFDGPDMLFRYPITLH